VIETTRDQFLNGHLTLRQPRKGFRSGLDAVMLAAAVPARASDKVLELGAGAGVASLCLAARARCAINGVDIDATLVALANENAANNDFADRVGFEQGDALSLPPWLRREFDHVFSNPPFHRSDGQISPSAARVRAMQDHDKLGKWLDAGLKRTASNGTLTMIVRADRLRDLLARAPEHGVAVFPLWPHGVEPAKRVILQIRKGSHAQSVILPGLVLHEEDGQFTREANAILRGESHLRLSRRLR
jgi:tRNA1(Val) A37 N6-methylase TrmN6